MAPKIKGFSKLTFIYRKYVYLMNYVHFKGAHAELSS